MAREDSSWRVLSGEGLCQWWCFVPAGTISASRVQIWWLSRCTDPTCQTQCSLHLAFKTCLQSFPTSRSPACHGEPKALRFLSKMSGCQSWLIWLNFSLTITLSMERVPTICCSLLAGLQWNALCRLSWLGFCPAQLLVSKEDHRSCRHLSHTKFEGYVWNFIGTTRCNSGKMVLLSQICGH